MRLGTSIHLRLLVLKGRIATPLRGYHGAGVLEVVEDHDRETYRAVYTVRFQGVVYALHAFQKKAKKGIATPKHELDVVDARLKAAEEDYEEHRRTRP
jgi:phage-related protein